MCSEGAADLAAESHKSAHRQHPRGRLWLSPAPQSIHDPKKTKETLDQAVIPCDWRQAGRGFFPHPEMPSCSSPVDNSNTGILRHVPWPRLSKSLASWGRYQMPDKGPGDPEGLLQGSCVNEALSCHIGSRGDRVSLGPTAPPGESAGTGAPALLLQDELWPILPSTGRELGKPRKDCLLSSWRALCVRFCPEHILLAS